MKKIPLSDLKVGDRVLKLDRGWFETGLLTHKFIVKDISVIDRLKKNDVTHVFIECSDEECVIDELFAGNAEKVVNEHQDVIAQNYLNLSEIKNVSTIYRESVKVVKSIMEDIRTGKLFSGSAVKSVASNIAEITVKNRGVLSSITKLRQYDDYTFHHSMNVSIFAASLAAHLGMSKKEIEDIAKAGLLHDVGKMLIPQEILNKPARLTEPEYAVMKTHVEKGYDLLFRTGLQRRILNLTLEHHERYDGSGYPNGLKDEQISIEGKIGAVVDIYDAITSDRVYHKGMEAAQALRLMFKWTDSHINRSVFDFFVKNIGIYPVGSLVLMDNNELGVIGRINSRYPTCPVVVVFSDNQGRQKPLQVLDMAVNQLVRRKIVGPVNPKDILIPDEIYLYIEKMNELK